MFIIPALVSIVLSAATAAYAGMAPLPNSFAGQGTWYEPTQDAGVGACGFKNDSTQLVVAIAFNEYNTFPGATLDNPNTNPICNQRIQLFYPNAPEYFVAQVVDKCQTCENKYDVDMSLAVFETGLGISRDVGRVQIQWVFVPKTTALGRTNQLPPPPPPDTISGSSASPPAPAPPPPPRRRSLRRASVRRRLVEESEGVRALPSERSTNKRETPEGESGAPGDPIESRSDLSKTHVDTPQADNPVPRYVPSPRTEDLKKRMANVQPSPPSGPIETGNHLSQPHVQPAKLDNPVRHVPKSRTNNLKRRMAEEQEPRGPNKPIPVISKRKMLKSRNDPIGG